MEFRIGKSTFLKELGFVYGVVERKSTIPILSNLLIEAQGSELKIRGTDLDLSLSTVVDAEVKEAGAVCVQAKKLFEIVRALPESDIEVRCNGQDQLSIVCERSRFRMPWVAKESFPEVQEFRGQPIEIPADMVRTLISRTAFAITNEESRYSLNGAKFELSADTLRMVATDGHRLAFIEKQGSFGMNGGKLDVIIPRKALTELAKLCADTEETVVFGYDDNHLYFRVGRRHLSSRLLSGQFPNYEMVLPKDNQHRLLIESARIASAIRRVALMADERSHLIKFDLGSGQMNITSQAADVGEAGESIPVEYDGAQIAVGFNAQYLNEFFNVVQDGQVAFEFKDGNSQAQIRPQVDGDYDFRYIIMPMRL